MISHPDKDKAVNLVKHLVNRKLAACGHVFPPGTSVYRWKGDVLIESEVMIVLKTASDCGEELVSEVKKNHPYEVPEILFQPIDGGSADYLSWIMESVVAGSGGAADRKGFV